MLVEYAPLIALVPDAVEIPQVYFPGMRRIQRVRSCLMIRRGSLSASPQLHLLTFLWMSPSPDPKSRTSSNLKQLKRQFRSVLSVREEPFQRMVNQPLLGS